MSIRIDELVKDLNLSYEMIADFAGVNRHTVELWGSGLFRPSINQIRQIVNQAGLENREAREYFGIDI